LPLSPTDETLLSQTIKQHLKPTSPILLLYQKRIYKLLVYAFLSSASASSPSQPQSLPHDQLMRLVTAYSLQSKGQLAHVKETLKKAKLIFEHNLMVFGALYSAILRAKIGHPER
jgi:hypothetical protein